jgi:hypothetical protein
MVIIYLLFGVIKKRFEISARFDLNGLGLWKLYIGQWAEQETRGNREGVIKGWIPGDLIIL